MKRKDFIKNAGLLGGTFFLPKQILGYAGEIPQRGKSPLIPGLRSAGFQTKHGQMYGFTRDGKDYTEEVIVEFSRKPLQDTKDKDSDMERKLTGYLRLKMKQKDIPRDIEDCPYGKTRLIRKRLIYWFGGLEQVLRRIRENNG